MYTLVKTGDRFSVRPCHLTALKKEKHIHLLLLEENYIDEKAQDDFELMDQNESNTNEANFHYIWIKDLSRLISSQVSATKRKLYLCDRCLHFFKYEDHLIEHEKDCSRMNKCKIVLPSEKDNQLHFTNYRYKEKSPFIIYGDFESILKPIEDDSKAYNLHEAFSVGMYIKCSFDETRSQYLAYRKRSEMDQDASEWFVDRLLEFSQEVKPLYDNIVKMNPLSLAEEREFKNAKSRHICEKVFSKNEIKIHDHCHFTGR